MSILSLSVTEYFCSNNAFQNWGNNYRMGRETVLLGSLEKQTEKAMATHSTTLAWKIPWAEEPGGLQSRGHEELDTTEWLHFHFSLSCIREGNGSPLQCSCLENPRDGGAWWAAIYGVAQSRTRLKWLSSSSSSSRETEPIGNMYMHTHTHTHIYIHTYITYLYIYLY